MSYDGPTPPPMFPRSKYTDALRKITAAELRRIIAASNPFSRIEDRESDVRKSLLTR